MGDVVGEGRGDGAFDHLDGMRHVLADDTDPEADMMTEAAWAISTNPEAMLKMVRPDVSERKLRLFACACARWFWTEFDDPRSRAAIEMAERYADGLASNAELRAACQAARAITRSIRWTTSEEWAAVGRHYSLRSIARDASQRRIRESVLQALRSTLHVAYLDGSHPDDGGPPNAASRMLGLRSMEALKPRLSDYLRDIFAYLFHETPALDPSVLACNDQAVRHVAQAIYEERDFERMPILADALEDAGCTDKTILAHCRGGGPHVRGCWVVDLILGRC
jgi:hypothetical protein